MIGGHITTTASILLGGKADTMQVLASDRDDGMSMTPSDAPAGDR